MMKLLITLICLMSSVTLLSQPGKGKPDCQDTINSLKDRYVKTIQIAKKLKDEVALRDNIVSEQEKLIQQKDSTINSQDTQIIGLTDKKKRKNLKLFFGGVIIVLQTYIIILKL